ncbi:MAG: GNAT family N-acetyltransferase [Candidatus Magasanikbacteria bacterium]
MNLFSGIKILDLTRVFSGPFATRHFSDFGAEVIKIEPSQGDDSRKFPPHIGNWSGYFEILNRNKKSIILDLKNDKDLEKFYKLCKNCDVVVENFSPDVAKRLKIDYQTIAKINSNVIYASISGVSENIVKKYYDVIAQAESGLISLNGECEDMKNATSVVDAFSGMKLAFAISSALYGREKTKRGCKINVSMKGTAFDLLEQNLINTSVTNINPKKVGNMDSAIAPFGVFKTKNGAVVVAIGNNDQWERFEAFLLKHGPKRIFKHFATNILRLKNIQNLKTEIEQVFSLYLSKNIIKILEEKNIPCGQVKTMRDVINDEENYEENLLEKIKHPIVGDIVVPTGGIFFSKFKKEKYRIAPALNMEYKEYKQEHTSQVVELLNKCFPNKKVTEKSFLWKHFDKFFNNKSVGIVALEEGVVCAFVCFTPIAIVNGENIYNHFYSCAIQATHPDFRRQGIVSKLTLMVEDKLGPAVEYIGFSNSEGVKIDKFSKKINYEILGQMATKYVVSLPYFSNFHIKQIDEINFQPKSQHNTSGFLILKNNEYLKWRYKNNPKNIYEYFEISKEDVVAGYIICKNSKLKYEVNEVALFENKEKTYKEAIKAFSKFSINRGKFFVSYSYLQNKFWKQCFPLLSFTKKINIYFTIKTADTNLEDVDKWRIQGGDVQ